MSVNVSGGEMSVYINMVQYAWLLLLTAVDGVGVVVFFFVGAYTFPKPEVP